MNRIAPFIQLIRPLNLAMVAFTVYAMRKNIITPLLEEYAPGLSSPLSSGNVWKLVWVLVLITAAGNVINDYFDLKVDKINKPKKVLIGKSIKRRVAMFMNHGLNILAVALCASVCYDYQYWIPLAIPLLAATLLWWYSPVLKKKPLIGNLVIALLVAIVPLWTSIFEIHLIKRNIGDLMIHGEILYAAMWQWVMAFAAFAFILTLAREIIKDHQDIEGDITGQYRTMPIIWGNRFTANYTRILLLISLAGVCALPTIFHFPLSRNILLPAVLLIGLPHAAAFALTFGIEKKEQVRRLDWTLKIAMVGGIVCSFFIPSSFFANL